jgi:hypothetical protein
VPAAPLPGPTDAFECCTCFFFFFFFFFSLFLKNILSPFSFLCVSCTQKEKKKHFNLPVFPLPFPLTPCSEAESTNGAVARDVGQASVCRVMARDECVPQPLVLHHIPIASTYALFAPPDGASEPMVASDPTALEEKVALGTLTVVSTAQGEVMAVQKAGEMSAPHSTLARCVAHAVEGAVEADTWIKARVAEAIPKQYVRGMSRGK